jgi:hypothetical protein
MFRALLCLPTATQERDDQCGNQHYSRELLMMGILVPETRSRGVDTHTR